MHCGNAGAEQLSHLGNLGQLQSGPVPPGDWGTVPGMPSTHSLTTAHDSLRLSAPVQAALLAVAHRRMLAPGDSLFLKGSMPDALFGVVQGTLRVSVTAQSGREAVIAVLQPGHWFGEVSLLVGQERVYDTFATEPTEMAVVSAPDFHRLIASSFEIHMAFTRLIGLRLRQALRWIDDAILSPLPARLAHRRGRPAARALRRGAGPARRRSRRLARRRGRRAGAAPRPGRHADRRAVTGAAGKRCRPALLRRVSDRARRGGARACAR